MLVVITRTTIYDEVTILAAREKSMSIKQWGIKYHKWLGVFAIIVCILTWYLEISGIVYVCPYCRIERTVIGLLGVIMLLPRIPYITMWFVYGFAFLGANVAASQLFLTVKNSNFFNLNFNLAFCALFFIILQVLLFQVLAKKA